MKLFLLLILFLLENQNVDGVNKFKLKKFDCTVNKEFIEVKDCFVKPVGKESYELNFFVVFLREVKSLTASVNITYKYSGTPRTLLTANFNLCKKLKFRSVLEEIIFREIYNGFRVKQMGKLCPLKAGSTYYADKNEFNAKQIPEIAPTGDFTAFVNYVDEKNVQILFINIGVSLTRA